LAAEKTSARRKEFRAQQISFSGSPRCARDASNRQKKRPVKRPGVKPNGARLYKRFLAGGMQKVGNACSIDKAKFPAGKIPYFS
jgi:hypothetical protein